MSVFPRQGSTKGACVAFGVGQINRVDINMVWCWVWVGGVALILFLGGIRTGRFFEIFCIFYIFVQASIRV